MSDRIKWTDCDGFTILSVDYSDLPEAEYLEAMEEVEQVLQAFQGEPSDSAMLIMANVTNTRATKKIRHGGKEISAALDGFKGHAYAVIGVTGVMKLLANAQPPIIVPLLELELLALDLPPVAYQVIQLGECGACCGYAILLQNGYAPNSLYCFLNLYSNYMEG